MPSIMPTCRQLITQAIAAATLITPAAAPADDGGGDATYAPCQERTGGDADELAGTPRRHQGIEALGLTLTDAIAVSDALYARLLRDITAIKQRNPQLVGLEHRPEYDTSSLLVKAADDATAAAIRASEYTGWDCLRQRYAQTDAHNMFGRHFDLRFKGVYDMRQLGNLYAQLPDIEATSLNLNVGDGSTIRVDRNGAVYTYRFHRKWGDCPSGCIENLSWTYRVGEAGGIELVSEPPTGAPQPPDWVE